ncbi:MAG: hypothetical protein IJX85_04245 [Lachnospiraceae bacterium]|nr:hypothetical protein [Lachnospiraceae bacterium]
MDQLKRNKIKLKSNDLFSYIFLLIVSIESGIRFTEFQLYGIASRILLFVEIIFFLIVLIGQKYKITDLYKMILLLIFGIASYSTTGSTQLLVAIMTAIVFSRLDWNNALNFLFATRLSVMLIINGLSIFGVTDINSRLVGKSYGVVEAYGLGYNHPNRYAYSILYLQMLYLCLKKEKVRNSNLFFVLITGSMGYSITKSRTLLIATLVLVVLVFLFKTKLHVKLIIKIMDCSARFVYLFCALFSLLVPYVITKITGKLSLFFSQISDMMSGRLSIINMVYENCSITLFGGEDDFISILQKQPIDNGYVNILFGFGIVGLSLVLIFFYLTIDKLTKRQEYIYVICMIIMAFVGISENILLYNSFNIGILFWGVMFTKYSIESDSVKKVSIG